MNYLLNKHLNFLADKLSGKTILVSGATGLIGARIIALIATLHKDYNDSIKGIGLYRNDSKLKITIPTIPEGIDFVRWDMDGDQVPIIDKYDAIIHCAGISGGKKMHLRDPKRFFITNIGSTQKLLDYNALHCKAPFLFVSTYEVYGDVQQKMPFNENFPCNLNTFEVRSSYAEMKRMSEMMCCMWSSQFDFKSYSVRLTSTFGEGVEYNDPRFFAEFARCIIEERDIILKSSGGTMRSYLDVDDAAIAMLYVIANGHSGNAYNLTNMNNAISIRDIANRMIKVAGSNIQLKFDIVGDVSKLGYRKEGCTLMDSTKLMDLGWKPVYTLDETIEKMIRSMKNNKN